MTTSDNPDRRAIEAFMAGDGVPAPMDSSPLLGALGCCIEQAEPGRVRISFTPDAAFVQGNGVVAGGIVATMLDFALAFAGLTTCSEGENVTSIGLNTAFLGPVKAGPVVVEASLASSGFRIAHAEARLADTSGRVLASATSALSVKRHPSPRADQLVAKPSDDGAVT